MSGPFSIEELEKISKQAQENKQALKAIKKTWEQAKNDIEKSIISVDKAYKEIGLDNVLIRMGCIYADEAELYNLDFEYLERVSELLSETDSSLRNSIRCLQELQDLMHYRN